MEKLTVTTQTSERVGMLPRSCIRVVMEAALKLPNPIRLDVGDPDFTTPNHIIEAASEAASSGFTHYAPSVGLHTLRSLIAEKVGTKNNITATPDDIVVTPGACAGIHAAFVALLDPGDEVLLPDPGWTANIPIALLAGLKPAAYPLDMTQGFAVNVDMLEECIGPRTRAVVMNSPGNPTGAVTPPDVLERVVDLTRRRGLWLISDECYEDIIFEGEHRSPAGLADRSHVVTVFSFSKSYAMTGWRIGYLVAPNRTVAGALARVIEPIASSASTVSQKAAEAALTGPQDVIETMRDAYRRRRDIAITYLHAGNVPYVRPSGTFYLMIDVTQSHLSAEEFADSLLKKHQVAVVPGPAFGPTAKDLVRLSLAAAESDLEAGLQRITTMLSP